MAAFLNLINEKRTYRSRAIRENPLDHMNDDELYKRYRFNKNGLQFLFDTFGPELKHNNVGNAIAPEIQILATLHYLASNTFQIHIGDSLKMTQPSVSNSIKNVITTVTRRRAEFICFPNAAGRRKTMHGFASLNSFPSVVGCVDGTHIPIQLPPKVPFPEDYKNRKGFYSINCQVVVDHQGKFLQLNASYPGSAHDSSIIQNSSLWTLFEETPIEGKIFQSIT